MTSLRFGTVPTPVGTAVIAVGDEGLIGLDLDEAPPEHVLEPVMRHLGVVAVRDDAAVEHIATQLHEFFAGERTAFDVDIDWSITRGFPRAALQAICDIPYGETAAYGEIAITAGSPGAARAVGTACANAPISLVVPVHRVVRSDGTIGRYGRHPEAKRFLIDLERANTRAGV